MRALRTLRRDTRGAALVEFAIIAPAMMTLIFSLCDLSYNIYAKSVLNGALQKAARDAAIQGGANNTAAIDGKVTAMMKQVTPNATITFVRKSFYTFSAIKPEPFVDTNANGVRDSGECYTDMNGNARFDADGGADGQGGANDVTLYTATVSYKVVFNESITATTLLKNQPYASQTVASPATICT